MAVMSRMNTWDKRKIMDSGAVSLELTFVLAVQQDGAVLVL
jgi:hypothetical protein